MKKDFIKKILKVKKSKAGMGLFANDSIKKDDFLIEYIGEILSVDEANKKGGRYLFEVNSKKTIDGSIRQNMARYINHSCRPNCEVKIKKGRVLIYAKKNIRSEEELSYDYGKEYFDEYIKPYGCRCKKCE
ncbi:MAG: SET domain-containing protein-lysine N-methyltransferase [Patescibacteria group bacterium]